MRGSEGKMQKASTLQEELRNILFDFVFCFYKIFIFFCKRVSKEHTTQTKFLLKVFNV